MNGNRLEWGQFKRFIIFCAVSIVVVVLAGMLYSSLLVPILISLFLAYLLLPLVELLQRRRLPRAISALLIVLGLVTAIVVAGIRLVPVVYRQALMLVQLIPGAVNTLLGTWMPIAERYVANLGIATPDEVHHMLAINNVVSRVASQLEGSLVSLWKTGTSVAGGMLTLVLIPVLTFFLLKDYHSITRFLDSLVPRDLTDPVHRVVQRMSQTLRSVLQGQAIVAGILTALYVIGLSAVGLQSSVAIGVVAGICRFIPYLDVIVGGTLSTIVLLSSFPGWGGVLSVVLVFLAVQAIDGAVITPAVIGDRVGLHPLLVILSVLAFADWLGFWGVLLAVPVVAILKVVLEAAMSYYRESRIYLVPQRDGALEPAPLEVQEPRP